MTDTGQIPGEGLPENAGMVEQPGVAAPGAYTYLSETTAEDEDLLLLPGAQSAWGNEVAPPAPEPVVEAVHEPEAHETSGRDSGSFDLGAVRTPGPAPVAPRRPLHLGPPIPDASASPVRTLADRGPAATPNRPAGPPATGPEHLDPPQPATPWGPAATPEPQADSGAGTAETVVPAAGVAQAVVERVAGVDQEPVEPAPLVEPMEPMEPMEPVAPMEPVVSEAAGAAPEQVTEVPGPVADQVSADVPGSVAGEDPVVSASAAGEGLDVSGPVADQVSAEVPGPVAGEGLGMPGPVGGQGFDAPGPAEAWAPEIAEAPVAEEARTPDAPEAIGPQDNEPSGAAPEPEVVPVPEPGPETPPAPVAVAAPEPATAPEPAAAPEPVTPPEPAAVSAPEPDAEAPHTAGAVPAPEPEAVPAAEAVPAPVPTPTALPDPAAPQAPAQVGPAPGNDVPAPSPEAPLAAAPGTPEATGEPGDPAPEQPAPAAPLPPDAPVEAAQQEPVQPPRPSPEQPPVDAATPPPAAPDETAPVSAGPEESASAVPAEPEEPAPAAPEGFAAPEQPVPDGAPPHPETTPDPQHPHAAQPAPVAEPVPSAPPVPPAQAPQPPAPVPGPQFVQEQHTVEGAPQSAPEQEPAAPAPGPAQGPQSAVLAPEAGTETAPAPVGPAPREGDVQHADDLDTRAAEQEDQEAASRSTGPAAPGYDDAERAAVLKVMRERRDIRNGFRGDPIPHEVLLRVLEAAHTAPSVGHSQPWDFVVIRSAETRRAMHELAMRQREAYAKSLPKGRAKQFKELKIEAILDTPVNIVVTADSTRGGRHTLGRHTQPQMAPYSSALAVENFWLAARAEGLGVGWVSFFDEREMVRALGLPEHLDVVAYLCVGYVDEFPDEPELMQAGWSKRRPLSWVVHEETYGRRALPGEEPHDLLAETVAQIRPLDAKALGEAWERQKRMTKPAGALGMLEIISAQLSGLSRQCPPPIPEPAAVAVFAGDHGVHAQGVTHWPQEVTAQMVANFLGGGAVCNAFATQVGAEVCVVDVGVAADLPATPGLLPRKVRAGTSDMTAGPAMTREEAKQAIEVGIETARDLVAAGNKALLTGEMGIANTTASAALISVFTGADPAEVTGRGTGINDETLARKTEVVRRAIEVHQPDPADPIGVLAAVGGLEHAAMVGLLLGGASLRTPVILDGVSAGAAALVARAIAPEVLAACIAGHRSAEPGHVAALNKLGLRPLVDLDLRLGEGTGALLALPMVQSTARAMHEVATFDSAGVTEK
ncbi:nicotinate-nucleotide--dimethylbenzimidazole phosphoribosyltransferase [Streptomyces sp. NPDC023723]|uniref:nicotinate-nucleotide--dimethylbenzimidazole phosphoribosyltransferase n=1 Tax=Streptomyces sp. NPDC023723 TaxID=3154323 RepID=UPI00340B3722